MRKHTLAYLLPALAFTGLAGCGDDGDKNLKLENAALRMMATNSKVSTVTASSTVTATIVNSVVTTITQANTVTTPATNTSTNVVTSPTSADTSTSTRE